MHMRNLFAVIGLCLAVSACGEGYSQGERIGVINKLSYRGIFCKTWEGSMNLGGFRNKKDNSGNITVVANTWEFTIQDRTLVSKVEEAMKNGENVTVKYEQWFIGPPCQTDSGYIVTSIVTN